MAFLSEALAISGQSSLPPFAECAVLATLFGRCMTHRRLALAAALSSQDTHEFCTRQEWLSALVEKRTQVLIQSSPDTSPVAERDPMLVFVHMLAHSTVIYLSHAVDTSPWRTVEHELVAIAYEQRARQAATEVVRLARAIPRLSCFKVCGLCFSHPFIPFSFSLSLFAFLYSYFSVFLPILLVVEYLLTSSQSHPFLPNTLYRAATFLMRQSKTPLSGHFDEAEEGVTQLLHALRNLRDVNNSAREYLYQLEVDGAFSSNHSSTG